LTTPEANINRNNNHLTNHIDIESWGALLEKLEKINFISGCKKIEALTVSCECTGNNVRFVKTHRLLQVDIDRREQCCAANYEQVVNHVNQQNHVKTKLLL
jgi:hypothetical protein